MKIGITKSESKFEKCIKWLNNNNADYEILDYENSEEDQNKIKDCSGLILSGGVDIYPELYCDWDTKETKGTYCPERDGFELNLLQKALEMKIPVLGICRGLQLINVYFRGSLIFDIEEIRNVNHRKISKTEDRIHKVNIFKDTLLNEITGTESEEVTSSHHQSIDRLGEGLMINAKASDGIVEGIEFADKKDKSFLIGVQWHPERITDPESRASKYILRRFIEESEIIKIAATK